MKIVTDVDIDFLDRTTALQVLPHIAATLVSHNKMQIHPTGIYFQNIPVDPVSHLASIPYKQAEEVGYLKIDFINNKIYDGVKDEQHLSALSTTEPIWELLGDFGFVSMLAHVHDHFDIVKSIAPKSVIDLAIVLALIRPGKRHLVGESREVIDKEIWNQPKDGSYFFKKSHAVAFAVSIIIQMNLLVEQA